MKTVAFVVCFLSSISTLGQNSTAFDQLTKEFEDFYFISLKDKDNFFEALLHPSSFVLRIDNPSFRKAKQDLAALYPEKDNEGLIKIVTDSILRTTGRKLLWKGSEAHKHKLEKVLKEYVDKTCACATVKVKDQKEPDLPGAAKICEMELLKDEQFRNRMFVNSLTLSTTEKLKVQEFSAKFNYVYCPAWNEYFNNTVTQLVYGNYVDDLRSSINDIDEKVVSLYVRKKTDSLALIFPNHKAYEEEIKKSVANKHKYRSSLSRQETKGQLVTITRTYITRTKPMGLIAQVIYEVELKDDIVKMNRYSFISSEKIKDKKKLLEELEGLPVPPPNEEINSY